LLHSYGGCRGSRASFSSTAAASTPAHPHPRVAAAAGADEVLVSSTVKDLVAGCGICFTDPGTHVLEGVPGEWRLFAAAV
jgi:hypothetical protein